MKNMKISKKLTVSFLIIIAFTLVVGGVGITGMQQISSSSDRMYNVQTKPMMLLANAIGELQEVRFLLREYIVYSNLINDPERIASVYNRLNELIASINEDLDAYAPTITNPDSLAMFNEARRLADTDYFPFVLRAGDYAKVGDSMSIYSELGVHAEAYNTILDTIYELYSRRLADAAEANDDNAALFYSLLLFIILALTVAVVISLLLARYISGNLSKRIDLITKYMQRASTTGDLNRTTEEVDGAKDDERYKDEIAQLSNDTGAFVTRVIEIATNLEEVAKGNLAINVKLLSEKDTMGTSLKKMTDSLNEIFGEINVSATQVSSGSKQISDGAQDLAHGSAEQAATVEQLSASASEIAEKTKTNAEMAAKAAALANTIKGNAEKGSHQMDEMMTAVNEINQASQSISKVIKVIDDIAFQTNILALNAAVEAARAGQHGKGFAVVADEVRSLAAKSAEAAKDTSDMIANSMEKAQYGAHIANDTVASLNEIVSGIGKSSEIINEIAESSELQSTGIAQINIGIDQVTQVVQQNSATAEESAAASEELSSQAAILEQLVSQFKLRGNTKKKLPDSTDPA